MKTYAALARWSLGLVLGGWLLFALVWGGLHGWIVPRIDDYRPRLEAMASKVLGVPVRIGDIKARTEGLVPSFELRQVVLLDAEGREALRLERVIAALSPRSLWNWSFEQLYIDQPELDVRRAADGRIFVAGLDFSRGGENDGRAADWFFSQSEVVIHKGTVRWTDERRGAEPLALHEVNFVARNRGQRHQLRLDATPPPDWGNALSLRAEFRQPLFTRRAGQWQTWDGQLYGDFPGVQVARLRDLLPLGVALNKGQGAMRVWADVAKGEVRGATADVALIDAEAVLGDKLQPLALDTVSGRLSGRRLANGFDAATQNLQFRTREGLVWPGGNVALTWTGAERVAPAQGELRADRLDLEALRQIASRLPLGTATHAALASHAPKGLVETLQLRWQGEPGALKTYQAKGRLVGLEIAARPGPAAPIPPATRPPAGVPGLRGASLDFDLSQAGGKARLGIDRGALEFPGVFEDPVILLDALSADTTWRVDGPQLSMTLSNVKFANKDLDGQLQATWQTSDPARSIGKSRFPGVLDLQGTLSRLEGNRVHRYLPLAIHRNAREYVREAVVQGSASGVKVKIKGDLYNMPFVDPKLGEFRVSANVSNTTFAFVPRTYTPTGGLPWPALTQLNGELIFERLGMQVKGASGRLAGAPGLQVLRADASVADLAHSATVVVSAEVRGPLGEALAVTNASPLSRMTGQVLDKATANGNAEVRLGLQLPLRELARSKVNGSITLAGNDVQITPDSPPLGRARGVVNFTEAGFTLSGAQARMMGGDMRLEGGSKLLAPGSTEPFVQLRAQGTVSAEGLRQARELGPMVALAQRMQGSTAYTATLAFRRGVPEVMVASNLQGMALNLPAPLGKAADTVQVLRYENSVLRESLATGAPLMDQLVVDLGRLGGVQYVRDLSDPQTARVVRGVISLGLNGSETVSLPATGVAANINLGAVDGDAWEKVFSTLWEPAGADASGPKGNARAAQNYLPTVMAFRADEITLDGRTLHALVAGGSREGQLWRANVGARELNGYVEYRQPSGNGAGRVFARLARLSVAAGAASDVEHLLDEQPAAIPALDIVVDDLELRGRKLGRVEVEAVNRGSFAVAREGGVREWRLNKLNLIMPEATLSATGNWAALNAQAVTTTQARGVRAVPEQRRTVMNFRMDIADSGLLLSRFGMNDVIRRGKGKMEGQVAWLGSPFTLDYPSMTGAFNLNVEAGQFLKADPGLAKLLGVLSLQSLPRRLALDFRDVFSEGFAFDFVRGDVNIQQGIASTNNLQMKGVNAAVLMEGKADIAKETQDLQVVVVPEINAGTASLVATVINPVVGLGTFLAQLVLRNPLIKANTQEFHIDGTWADPRVTRLERKPPDKP